MANFLPVSPETCANKCWMPNSGYAFTAGIQFASLTGAELTPAMHAMPLVFIRREDSYLLAGLLSLEPGANLYITPQGQWVGSYVPACFRGHPFRLAKSENNAMLLCVDQDSGLIRESGGNPFFDADGKLGTATKQVLQFMQQVWNNTVLTQQAVSGLDQAGLIAPWPLTVKVGQEEKNVAGIFRVDESRLNSLDDQAFLTLRKYLPIAYAQLFSMANVGILVRLAQIRAQAKPAQPENLDLDKLFGKNEELISFGDS